MRGEYGVAMKNILFVCFTAMLATSSFAQSPLSSPSKAEIESTIGGMGLPMGEKLSLRNILQGMQQQGEKVKADGSLSDGQKVEKIVKIRKDALGQTKSILTAPQQEKLAALLLPKQ